MCSIVRASEVKIRFKNLIFISLFLQEHEIILLDLLSKKVEHSILQLHQTTRTGCLKKPGLEDYG